MGQWFMKSCPKKALAVINFRQIIENFVEDKVTHHTQLTASIDTTVWAKPASSVTKIMVFDLNMPDKCTK